MRPRSSRRRTGVLAAALIACSLSGGAGAAGADPTAPAAERGFPLIQTYLPAVEEAQTQSFGIARDPRGAIYVANGGGVLVYDGAWWQAIPIGKAEAAFAVASDRKGRIGVGGIDEIGYLAPDEKGNLRYVSLVGLLPPAQRQLGQVADVHPTADGFVFLTARWFLRWNGKTVATLATFRDERPYAASFRIGEETLVWAPERGLARLAGERLVAVPGGEQFRGRRVDLVLPAEGGLLVSVRGEGLFRLSRSAASRKTGGQPAQFAPEASRWAVEKRLFSGCRLPDGRWALGSVLGGLLLLRPDGAVDQVIDTTVGLPDDFVNGAVVDREGSLWLALDNGIARIEVASPVSLIDRRAGLQGSPYALARHRGTLWVGTSAGLFTVAPAAGAPGPGAPAWGRPVQASAVPGLPPGGWSLLSLGEELLAGTAFGVYAIGGAGPRLVPGTGERTVYVLVRSTADPGRVWLGMADGLASIRREGAGWRYEGMVDGVPEDVRSIVEGAGSTVWCATMQDGVVGVAAPAGPAGKRRVRRVAASDGAGLFRIGGRLLAAREDRVLLLGEARAELTESPELASLAGHGRSSFLAEDAEGNLWRNTRPPTVALRRGRGWAPELRSLVEVAARSIEPIFAEPDGVVWLATENGLYRYAGSLRGEAPALPAPRFARLAAGGALLAGGAGRGAPPAADLAPDVRRLRIEFAPLTFRAGLRYQTRIEPLDAGWSEPAAEPFAELTRLPPGRYTFGVRTVGPNREVGPPAAWAFRVRPPWYRTPWAFALWAGAALLGLRAYTRLRDRTLRQRAARLEDLVAGQTIELRHTVEELRRAQDGLKAANVRLEELSLQDDLTGIANRRCLQQALEEEWSRARRHGLSTAFVLLDLDHFKLLNDSRGHAEGDRSLQAVAGYLAATVRRPGDLVARYGGEEFAVLLPATELAGARQVAEQLRAGIEALAIRRDRVSTGVITASFGVAVRVPVLGERPQELVEAADLALYRAKTEGRNRVCAVHGEDGEDEAPPARAAGISPLAS